MINSKILFETSNRFVFFKPVEVYLEQSVALSS
jgi:hypothetical protein